MAKYLSVIITSLILLTGSGLFLMRELLSSEEGKELLVKTGLDYSSNIMACDECRFVTIKKILIKYGLVFPTFVAGYSGDRGKFFDALNKVGEGSYVPFADGIMSFSYNDVANVVMSENQPRGTYVGAMNMSETCMGENTLIFKSTGPEHTKMRELLQELIPAFKIDFNDFNDFNDLTESTMDNIRTNRSSYDYNYKHKLIKTLFKAMFGSSLRDNETNEIYKYFDLGPKCLVGIEPLISEVPKIRQIVHNAIYDSPIGQNFVKTTSEKYPDMNIEETIMQLADGFLFAGLLGTENLVSGLLERIRENNDRPEHYELWNVNPTKYILEHARLKPPVTSVTSLLTKDTNITLYDNHTIMLKAGTTNQLALSVANKDPLIWGGKYNSIRRANEFDPTRDNLHKVLSWNGPEGSPRRCPAYHLSMSIAKLFVNEEIQKNHQIFLNETSNDNDNENEDDQKSMITNVGLSANMNANKNMKKNNKNDSTVKYVLTERSVIDRYSYYAWIITCFCWIVYLSIYGKGTFTALYSYYLLFQIGIGVGAIFNDQLYYQSILLAGTMYILIFVNYKNNSHVIHLIIQTAIVFMVWIIISGACLWLSIDLRKSSVNNTCMFYYFIAALHMINVVFNADKTKSNIHTQCGKTGAIWGSLSIVLNVIPIYGIMLSRLVDIFLYVPNAVHFVIYIEKRDKQNKLKNLLNRSTSNIVTCIFVVLVAIIALKIKTFTTVSICDNENENSNIDMIPLCENNKYMQMDLYARFMFNILNISDQTDDRHRPEVIKLPQWDGPLEKTEIFPGIYIPIEDEDLETSSIDRYIKDLLLNDIVRERHMFPLEDKYIEWDNIEEARETLSKTTLIKNFEANVLWDPKKYTSDETISQIAFAGIAAIETSPLQTPLPLHLSNTINAVNSRYSRYSSDFMWLNKFEVRSGFEKYGAIAYFDEKQELIGIMIQDNRTMIFPGDSKWNNAKWVWKCSMMVGITVKIHLVEIHMLYANFITTVVREYIPGNHPLRRFIKPFNYRTAYINYGASMTLMKENGQLHRTTAFTMQGLQNVFEFAFSQVRYSEFPDRFNSDMIKNLGETYPFGIDGIEFYQIVHKFVQRYISVYYKNNEDLLHDKDIANARNNLNMLNNSKIPQLNSTDSVINMLTDYILYVTAIHGIVGHVNEYLIDPTFIGSRIRIDKSEADVATSIYDNLLAGMTTNNAPRLMNDFTNLLLLDVNFNNTCEIFNDFQKDLEQLEIRINEKNKKRKWPFNGFNPRYLAASVSS
jgi:hypothetical protein